MSNKIASRRLLLLSNSTQHGSSFLQYCVDIVKDFFSKNGVSKVLFIPYAVKDHKAYAQKAKTAFQNMGLELESIAEASDPVKAAQNAEAFFIGGGNTFLLLKKLYDNNLIDVISKQVLLKGVPYMGASAGTNVATLNICTTNDMPIVYPPSFSALNLVPFNINAHYIDPELNSTHMGETREERIREYHEADDNPPVLGLREGCILCIEENKAVLLGSSGAKLFKSNESPIELPPGSDVSFLLAY